MSTEDDLAPLRSGEKQAEEISSQRFVFLPELEKKRVGKRKEEGRKSETQKRQEQTTPPEVSGQSPEPTLPKVGSSGTTKSASREFYIRESRELIQEYLTASIVSPEVNESHAIIGSTNMGLPVYAQPEKVMDARLKKAAESGTDMTREERQVAEYAMAQLLARGILAKLKDSFGQSGRDLSSLSPEEIENLVSRMLQ